MSYLFYVQLGTLFLLGFALGRFSHKPLPETRKRKKPKQRKHTWLSGWATRNRTVRKMITRKLAGDGLVVTDGRWDVWQAALILRLAPPNAISEWKWHEAAGYYCITFWMCGAPCKLYFLDSHSGYNYRLVLATCGSREFAFPPSAAAIIAWWRMHLRF